MFVCMYMRTHICKVIHALERTSEYEFYRRSRDSLEFENRIALGKIPCAMSHCHYMSHSCCCLRLLFSISKRARFEAIC